MPGPVKQVHVDQRRIRELYEKDLVAGNAPDRVRVDLSRQRVETVYDQPDIGMVRAADDLPGVAVVVYMPPPGQRLVSDAKAAFRRQRAKFGEVIRRPVDAAQRVRMNG